MSTPAAFAECPDCKLITANTLEGRRDHRAWHTHENKTREGLRAAVKRAENNAAEALATARSLATSVDEVEDRLRTTETTEPEPIQIAAWPEDELEPTTTFDDPEPAPTTADPFGYQPGNYGSPGIAIDRDEQIDPMTGLPR